jgi:two-component system OmpR family response regulator
MAWPNRARHHQAMALKLLLVDDSDLIRISLQALLEPIAGIEAIYTADTLIQTLESVSRLAPSLLILDIHLPDGNAIQIIPRLKQLAPRMRIAIFTNDVNEFNRRKCQQAGADWFFDKSIEFGELLAVVQQQAELSEMSPLQQPPPP